MFKTVKKGDPFKPNAKLTNETIKVINAFNSVDGFKTKTRPKNTTNIEISVVAPGQPSAFSPVRIFALNSQELSNDNLYSKRAYVAVPATDDFKEYPLAILQSNRINIDNILIKALVLGVSPAKINITDESHMYADTTADGKLESAKTGPLQILHQPGGVGEKWCTVLMGGGGAPAGDTYNGMFKVIDVSDGEAQKLKIVDGFADVPETYSYAGDALINDAIATDIAAKEFTITGNCFIYLIVYITVFGNIVANIEKFDAKQDYELGKSKTLISRVKFADGKITKFSQEIHGMITGFIDGECE
jgi:hypothetical protein